MSVCVCVHVGVALLCVCVYLSLSICMHFLCLLEEDGSFWTKQGL